MVNGHRPIDPGHAVDPKKSKKIEPKINTYNVIERAIEEGLRIGYNRAHKHTDTPTEEAILEQQRRAIMEQLDEVIKFD